MRHGLFASRRVSSSSRALLGSLALASLQRGAGEVPDDDPTPVGESELLDALSPSTCVWGESASETSAEDPGVSIAFHTSFMYALYCASARTWASGLALATPRRPVRVRSLVRLPTTAADTAATPSLALRR